mgnify:CR=1 FL=1
MPTRIPLSTDPRQRLSVQLGGEACEMRVRYGVLVDAWTFDLSIAGVDVLRGRRIVLGTDLLRAHALRLGSLVAVATDAPGSDPAEGDIGGRVVLVHEEP